MQESQVTVKLGTVFSSYVKKFGWIKLIFCFLETSMANILNGPTRGEKINSLGKFKSFDYKEKIDNFFKDKTELNDNACRSV